MTPEEAALVNFQRMTIKPFTDEQIAALRDLLNPQQNQAPAQRRAA